VPVPQTWRAAAWQGLTLVHFSAQPGLFLTQNQTPPLPLIPPDHPLNHPKTHPLSRKALTLS